MAIVLNNAFASQGKLLTAAAPDTSTIDSNAYAFERMRKLEIQLSK